MSEPDMTSVSRNMKDAAARVQKARHELKLALDQFHAAKTLWTDQCRELAQEVSDAVGSD